MSSFCRSILQVLCPHPRHGESDNAAVSARAEKLAGVKFNVALPLEANSIVKAKESRRDLKAAGNSNEHWPSLIKSVGRTGETEGLRTG